VGKVDKNSMRLILHIGQSKTGTSALQSFLFFNKQALLNDGFLYPDYYLKEKPLLTREHNAFAETLASLPRYPNFTVEEYIEQFHKQIKYHKPHTVILSAESFFGAPQIWRLDDTNDFYSAYEKKLKALKAFTDQFDTHLIGYFRSPEDWMEVSVSHLIRYYGLFGKHIDQSDENIVSLLSPHVDLSRLLELWGDIIQPQKMSVFPYEKDVLKDSDIINDFCGKAGLDLSKLSKEKASSKRVHASLDRRYVELKKMLNTKTRKKTEERVIIECLDILNSQLPEIERYRLPVDLKKKIQVDFKPYHIWLQENYSKGGKPFFSSKVNVDERDYQPISSEDIKQAEIDFRKLYSSYPIKWLYFQVSCKGFLRNRLPFLYAVLKNLFQ